MQLKVPPKEALANIEDILKEGDDLSLEFINKFLEIHNRAKAKDSVVSSSNTNNIQISITDNVIQLDNGKLNTEDPYLKEEVPRLEELYKLLDEKFLNWVKKAKSVLRKTFMSFVYERSFITDLPESNRTLKGEVGVAIENLLYLQRMMEMMLKHLQGLFFRIEKKADDPLSYIPESNTLCYYARVIPLQSSSNQSALCEFMFRFSIGEKKELAEILACMEGLDVEEMTKFDKQKVINAMNEINQKTKSMFGFPIFHKEKNIIYIQPS